MRILGIDPGSQVTGYGAIERQASSLCCITQGEIRPKKNMLLSASLIYINLQLSKLVTEVQPDAIAVENIFYGKNIRSLIKQAHVRGVIIFSGACHGIPVFEYSPLEVKQAVVGYGRAEKKQVQTMVKAILHLSSLPPTDAADALATAICHANYRKEQPI